MKNSVLAILSCAAVALASSALASGSTASAAPVGQLGQRVYQQKVACTDCAFAGGIKTRDQLTMALAKIESGEIEMSDAEKEAVTVFINGRFKGLRS